MDWSKNFLLVIFTTFLFSTFSTVTGLRCYQCSSYNNTECEFIKEDVNKTSPYLQECKGNYENQIPFCRKLKQTIMGYHKEPIVRINRECGWIAEAKTTNCRKYDNDFRLELVCECTDDGCNAAPQSLLSYTLLVLIALTIFVR